MKNGLTEKRVDWMIDKRFTQIDVPSDIIDTKSGKIYHTINGNDGRDLCILLNNLYEEIQALKKENKKLADALTVYFENKTKKGL